MNRINKSDLERLVAELNTRCGYATEPYTKQEDGKYKPNPFNYHLYWAYGGVALDQFGANGSGTRRISTGGCDTKRKLYDFLRAFLAGMEVSK